MPPGTFTELWFEYRKHFVLTNIHFIRVDTCVLVDVTEQMHHVAGVEDPSVED